MPKAPFSYHKVELKSNQSNFFNLSKKQQILTEYIEQEKNDIESVGKMIFTGFQKNITT